MIKRYDPEGVFMKHLFSCFMKTIKLGLTLLFF
jgi:hypothetical protein